MAKASEEKSDGLELVSIGKLYNGPWEKKYWSSSRGKDRYPYPVGYKAVRTQNGITHTMEIFEALKGPLFTISSTDGLSCSGQTPDIAWVNFQKKGCSQPKLWRWKRFSCKIDGMEFFGFKNPFVQRLLRELVANVGGVAEQNLLPSCIYDKASETRDPIPQTDLSTYPDLLPYLEKPGVTRKRSRKDKKITVYTKNVTGLKKVHIQDQGDNADISNIRQSCQGNSDTSSAAISNEFDNKAETWQRSEVLGPVIRDENLPVSAEHDLHMNSSDASDHPKVDEMNSMDKIQLTSCRNYVVMEADDNLPNDKNTFNCSVIKDGDGEKLQQNNMKSINDSQIFAPDTLDPHPGMNSQDLMTESYPDDETGSASSNPSSEKADFVSLGPEIAKSMMTVLLPRALPLLKTFSRRKRNKLKPLEKSTLISMDENGIIENEKNQAVLSTGEETSDLNQNKKEANSSDTTDPCVDHLESVVPDSFDNIGSESQFSKKLSLLPDIMVEDKSPVDFKRIQIKSITEAGANPPGCHPQAIDSKTELILDLEPNGGANLSSKSSIDITFHNKRDTFVNDGQSSLFVGPQSLEKNAKTLPDHVEGILAPANSSREKSETPVKKELAQDKGLSGLHGSMTDLQNQTVSYSSDAVLTAQKKEVEEHNSEMEDVLKIVACYIHPTPILVVLLSTVGNDMYLCLLCGSPSQENKLLFIYSAPISGKTAGCPSLVGHSSVILPFMKDSFGRNIALENSGVQFSPNAQSLVLVNSIKVPCCREGNIHCPCPSCSSDCFGDNGLKIVQVKVGYFLVVTKLRTAQNVCCLLVCEPNHLLASDESGKLYLWIMNSGWSGYMEHCYLLMPNCMTSRPVELKRVPKSAVLVVGHNGFGEFGLWDINKRILVSKFSAPSTSISGFVPISLFQWQIKGSARTYSNPEDLINEVLDATKMSFSGSTENKLALPIDGEDVAIWLLLSTISGPDLQNGYESGDLQSDTVECWKIALLVKDFVLMGSALDLRATAIGASSGHGIIGRSDGLVYMWELSTGIKVGSLHHFKGTGVSCIATDSSDSGALAIASKEGQLLVCMHSSESSAQCQC